MEPTNFRKKFKIGSRSDSIVLEFHSYLTGSLGAAGTVINANPTGITGPILTEADAWGLFKLLALEFRLIRSAAVATTQVGSYTATIQDTNPGTLTQGLQVIPTTVLAGAATEPSTWCRVSPQDLAGAFPWYKAIPGAADPTEETPGQIIVNGTTSDLYQIEIRGVCKFKGAVSGGNTPEELQARMVLRNCRVQREKETARRAIMRVLQPENLGLTYPCSLAGKTGQ